MRSVRCAPIAHPGRLIAALLAVAGLGGCATDKPSDRAGGDSGHVPTQTTVSGAGAGSPATKVAFRVPSDDEIPGGPVGVSIRRGRALLNGTRDSLPDRVGNNLRCTTCHLDDGRRPNAMSWVGVYARFPQYRSRSDAVILLSDRINDCFQRSLNGRAIDPAGQDMRDMIAYMAHLSRGYPVGAEVEGQGLIPMEPLAGDTTRGAQVFASTCVACHGLDGQGTAIAPALWGPRSYNIGAGMARVRTAASFIRHNMPFGNPTLTDQQAFDVATYINSRPRPDYAGKENDWPRGNPPPDVAYPTKGRRGASGSGSR